MENLNCDENGVCTPASIAPLHLEEPSFWSDATIVYVGDPMCSWCWGISDHLKNLQEHFEPKGVPYEIVLGGLRPGGGDPWNDKMKNFLRHHWEQVMEMSGQPFSYKLLDAEMFNYDTEPPCRAVVTAKKYLSNRAISSFFEEVQRKFYVENADPNELNFYHSICEKFELDFELFKTDFLSNEMRQATHREFIKNREWGVTGYPTVLFQHDKFLYAIAKGYATFEEMRGRIEQIHENWKQEEQSKP